MMKTAILLVVPLFFVGCSTAPKTANYPTPQPPSSAAVQTEAQDQGFFAWAKSFFRIKTPAERSNQAYNPPANEIAATHHPIPANASGSMIAIQNAEHREMHSMFSSLSVGQDSTWPMLTRPEPEKQTRYEPYGLTRTDTTHPGYAANRISDPADYRLIYYPAESDGVYAVEGGRELVKVRDERMRGNPFSPVARNGGNVIANTPSAEPPNARAYVAPDANMIAAAARLSSVPNNVEPEVGTTHSTVYRQACAQIGNPPRNVQGLVRPLGIQGDDEASYQAALAALDRRAGEVLVYFDEFGFGGFIATENSPWSNILR